ncbi:NAD(P)H-hydrate dehydratase [Paraferrimonas haliotis]|uniref:NAD(P)H-hydrate dehydratase n=1 Tax=Paraferrimonas haliotis TaxID=2013866 RepID=UPI000BA963B3|nr:NAD(P)H-hydrate dehydratase [Paraferrimonas haliotis]
MPLSQLQHNYFYRAEHIRVTEEGVIDSGLISGYRLMQQAAQAVFDVIESRYPQGKICIVCGPGNNGGDGYELAHLCHQAGRAVQVLQWAPHKAVSGDAHVARSNLKATGVAIQPIEHEAQLPIAEDCQLIVDAILGNRCRSEANAALSALFRSINQHSADVVSVDIPSGLHADTGVAINGAVNANITVTFGAYKLGLLTGQARLYRGQLLLADLGIGDQFERYSQHLGQRCDARDIATFIKPRQATAHKGQHGKLTVIGGDLGMPGSVKLAAEAALRAGTGLVTVVSHEQHQAAILQNRPELMFCRCELVDMEVYSRLGWANVLLLGPGLGQQEWGYNLFKACILSEKPLVLDADGLNMLAIEPSRNDNWILTPHSAEAARLLQCNVTEIENNRLQAVQALQQKFGGVVLLKGPGTLIYDGQQLVVADVGNPGLAVAGSGDLLSGIIAAIWAQGLSAFDATVAAALIHGSAADVAAEKGQRGMLPSDLLPYIRTMVNP